MDMTWADEVLAGHPFVVAHRGASAARPEHTLAAYDLALKEGADGVECDVRLTRDGHLVCVHDRRLDRTSTGAGLVSTMTLAQLRELEYGAWHDSWRPDGSHGDTSLLTLDALVSLVLDWHRPVKIFVETKHPVRYGSLVENKLLALLLPVRYCRTRLRRSIPCGGDVVFGRRGLADPAGCTAAADGVARQDPPIPDQQCGHGGRGNRRGTLTACVKGISATR